MAKAASASTCLNRNPTPNAAGVATGKRDC
jgi:hypothetical protein